VLLLALDLWLGGLLAWAGRARIAGIGALRAPVLHAVALFTALTVLPVNLYAHLVLTDWTWLYAFDARRMTGPLVAPFVAATLLAVFGGYLGVAALVRRGRARAALVVLAAVAGAIVVLGGVLRRRLVCAVLSDDPHGQLCLGQAPAFTLTVATLLIATLLAALYTVWELARDGRRVSGE
jgi:hypothetical protein